MISAPSSLAVRVCLVAFMFHYAAGASLAADASYQVMSLPQWREFVKSHSLADLCTDATIQGLMSIVADERAPATDRKQFALTLGRLQPPAVQAIPLFRRLLQSAVVDHDEMPLWSLKALGLMGPAAVSASPEVLQIVNDAEQSFLLRSTAMETLARIAPGKQETVASLIRVLECDRESVDLQQSNELRRAAAEAISLLGPDASPALPELLRALHSDWGILQRSAATALGALGPRGELAVGPLVDVVLFDESSDVREAAVDALGAIGRPALPALASLLEDNEQLVQLLGIRGLKQTSDSAVAVRLLKSHRDNGDLRIRMEIADAILKHQPDLDSIRVLIEGLQQNDRQIQRFAYRALQKYPDQLRPFEEELKSIGADPRISPQLRQAARRLEQSIINED